MFILYLVVAATPCYNPFNPYFSMATVITNRPVVFLEKREAADPVGLGKYRGTLGTLTHVRPKYLAIAEIQRSILT